MIPSYLTLSNLSNTKKMAKVKREAKYIVEINSTISIIGKTPQIPIATSQRKRSN